MEKALKTVRNPKKLIEINNCHLYLQITTMAKLVDVQGNYINQEVLYGSTNHNDRKTNDYNTISLHIWPECPRPPKKSWRSERKWLRTFMMPNVLLIKYPMHRWIQNQNPSRIWYKLQRGIIHDVLPTMKEGPQARTSKDTTNKKKEVCKMSKIYIAYQIKASLDEWEVTWALWETKAYSEYQRNT
jgi:hypothetical protein